jgi:hypothetical protein
MTIANFADLLGAARQQSTPQQLLFVFVNAELPDDCSAQQREAFLAGTGGALVPVMCVAKAAHELQDFDELVEQATSFWQTWRMVFVAALSGQGRVAPSSEQADAALQRMVANVKAGQIANFIPFDAQGQAVNLN